MGITQSKEYAEPEWYADLWLCIVWVTDLVLYIRTLARRREPHIYVANWYYLAFIIVVAMLHIVNNIPVPVAWNHSRAYSAFGGVLRVRAASGRQILFVGGLFAAFGFAISVFSLPMLLAERMDALTAMGTSMAMVWNNLPVMLTWGAIVMVLLILGLLPGLLGLALVFPLLGHATWHAYRTVRG